jgi:hypothetical protein
MHHLGEAEVVPVEGDRRIDVVDDVADADRWHLSPSSPRLSNVIVSQRYVNVS